MADRVFCLTYKPYVLNFKKPVKMARGVITQRRGVILKLEGGGLAVFSELVPLAYFRTESLESALAFLAGLSEITFDDLADIPGNLPATRFAIEMALLEILGEDDCDEYFRHKMPLSKLLPADQSIYQVVEDGLRDGFSIFKMKIGMREFKEEFEMVKKIVSKFTRGEKIRIDANESLSVEQARRWLGSLENFPVEFLEQPLKRHRVDETIELGEEFSTEVALDEAIATSQDMIDAYNRGFRGVFAAKPLRLAELRKFLDWRAENGAKISYSTIFETKIGSTFGIKLAASDKRNNFGLGYGVSHWFKESGLVLTSQPNFFLKEILSVNRQKIWERLA